MATPPHVPTVPNTPLLKKFNNDYTYESARLPSGPCNFTNLSIGGNAPRCGCQRFWDQSLGTHTKERNGSGSRGQARALWCMCEHHACYHNSDQIAGQKGQVSREVAATGGGQLLLNENSHSEASHNLALPEREIAQDEMSEVDTSQGQPKLPDTWNNYANLGSGFGSLPPIPSQCLLASENASGGSSQATNTRPFAGVGLQTLSHIPRATILGRTALKPDSGRPLTVENSRAMQIYEDSAGRAFLQSPTEVATPSLRPSQDPDGDAAFTRNVVQVQDALQKLTDRPQAPATSTLRPVSDINPISQVPASGSGIIAGVNSVTVRSDSNDGHLIPRLRGIINQVSNYPITMENHEQRLDLLENASFSNAGLEDLQESHDHLDTRVAELEGRVEEIEKAQASLTDVGSVGSRRHMDGSIDSRVSTTSSALIDAALDRIELSRFEALEAQVSELQAMAPPSYARPWEVEVVFLPFGSHLMGVWSSQHPMTQHSKFSVGATDCWTQRHQSSTSVTQIYLNEHEQALAWEHVSMDVSDDQTAWLAAKACGIRSRVDSRLRSRGLIKSIQIRGPDFRDVQAAILSEFGDLPTVLQEDPYTQDNCPKSRTIPNSLNSYLALQVSWIPLRKVHKDSCLQFLNASEMLTPATWTVPFLSSTVAMRTRAVRRLYVTQRDSYIQHLGNTTADWTWQKLRQLPRVYLDKQSSFGHTPEADAQETCWEWDERLDPPLVTHSSFDSHHSSLSIRSLAHEVNHEPTSPSDHFSSAAASPAPSTTPPSVPTRPVRPMSPPKERHPFRPIHARTSSMPSLIPIKSPPQTVGKRRIASFDNESQSSPTRTVPTLNLKRQRISRSPSRPRDTPRWSVGPPSPYFIDDVPERKRGATPFAYATPHSNAPYVEVSSRPRSGTDMLIDDEDEQGSATDDLNAVEGYDQNALSDYGSDSADDEQSHQPDQWEGVRDEMRRSSYESRPSNEKIVAGLRQDDGAEDEADMSDISSQPSEYPTTHPLGLNMDNNGAAFRIHVDEE